MYLIFCGMRRKHILFYEITKEEKQLCINYENRNMKFQNELNTCKIKTTAKNRP